MEKKNIKNLYFLFFVPFILISCSKGDSSDSSEIDSSPEITFNITISSKEGGSVDIQSGTYNAGTKLKLTATPDEGYIFSGWSNGSTENPLTITIDSNLTITASFERVEEPSTVANYLGTRCKEVSYASIPDANYTEGDYSYYTYGWQLDGTDQNSCVNSYQGVSSDGVDLVEAVLSDAKDKLGQIVPINAWIFHSQLSNIDTICSDYRPFTDDLSCFDLGVIAAATVTQYVLHNGGEFKLSEHFWGDEEQNGNGYKVAYHEYFHVHQNSHKFYFEETQNFGINMSQFRKVDENKGVNLVGPVWLEEGGAEFTGVWYSSLKGWVDYKEIWTNYLDEARSVISDAASRGDIVSLRDYETRYTIEEVESSQNPTGTPREFAYAYSAGGLAHIYLIKKGKTNLDNVVSNYYLNIAELERDHVGEGYKYAFEEYFGMPIDDFYAEFDEFMLKPREEQMSILELN